MLTDSINPLLLRFYTTYSGLITAKLQNHGSTSELPEKTHTKSPFRGLMTNLTQNNDSSHQRQQAVYQLAGL
jgi:hypothetical protein